MTPPRIDFHPQAIVEARAARRWYAQNSIAVASRFMSELDHALAQIASAPQAWPTYLHGTRVYQLRRFPYLVVYRNKMDTVQIIAVAYARRKPGYWRKRLPKS